MTNKELTKKLLEKLQEELEKHQEKNDLLLKIELIDIKMSMSGWVTAWFKCYYTSEDEDELYDYETEECVVFYEKEE